MSGFTQPGKVQILGQSGTPVSGAADTNENTLSTITVPAMGLHDMIEVETFWSYTNSANNKTLRVRLGGGAGTAYLAIVVTASATLRSNIAIANAGAANSQIGFTPGTATPFATSTSALLTSAVDTSAGTTIVITGQKATAGETITLVQHSVRLIRA